MDRILRQTWPKGDAPRSRRLPPHQIRHHPEPQKCVNRIAGVPGLLATVARKSTLKSPCELDPSVGRSGPRDFAVRFILARRAKPKRPSYPAPTFVTTRTPLSE